MKKESYRIDELAKLWSTSIWTVRRLIYGGKLPAFRVGVTWRVKHEERVRYEKTSATTSNDEQREQRQF